MTDLAIEPEDRVLDRLVEFDEKSKEYPIRELLRRNDISVPRSMTWRHLQLDQGREGACVGFSATTEAAARPAPAFGDPVKDQINVATANAFALRLYHLAQKRDDYDGEAYTGSSVLGGCKAAVEIGLWKGYRWALGPGPEAAALDVILSLRFGPVMMGTNWYEGMYRADTSQYLNVSGAIAGGHAFLLTAYSVGRDAVWTPNSWGGAGQGWISRAGLVRLLGEDGEAAMAVGRTRRVALDLAF